MKNKQVIFYQNQFYDDVFISFDITVPSKRIGYKQDESKKITDIKVPHGTKEFEKQIKEKLETKSEWPRKGHLLVAISISVKESDYKTKDIDNLAKSILDALKGIVFEDDVQIDMLHVQKTKSDKYTWAVGIKELDDDTPWYLPPLYGEEIFNDKQTYIYVTKYKK